MRFCILKLYFIICVRFEQYQLCSQHQHHYCYQYHEYIWQQQFQRIR